LYEGQLSNAGQAISKINQAIEAGLAAEITIVHISSEQALHNTIHRFHLQGRGASIEAMASIQGRLPDALRAVHERFGNAVKLHVIDRRGTLDAVLLHGWRHLPILESEGPMKTLNANSLKSLSEATDPVISRKTPTNKPLEKPQGISLDEWQVNALAGLNDKTEPFPPVW
jgi:hypothetical protein